MARAQTPNRQQNQIQDSARIEPTTKQNVEGSIEIVKRVRLFYADIFRPLITSD